MQVLQLVKLPKPRVIVISEEVAEWCSEGGGKGRAVMALSNKQELEARRDGWGARVQRGLMLSAPAEGLDCPSALVTTVLVLAWSHIKQLPFHLYRLIVTPPPNYHHLHSQSQFKQKRKMLEGEEVWTQKALQHTKSGPWHCWELPFKAFSHTFQVKNGIRLEYSSLCKLTMINSWW